MNRNVKSAGLFVFLVAMAAGGYAQSRMYDIMNFNGERRIGSFLQQINNIQWALKDGKFSEAKFIRFSDTSRVNRDTLEVRAVVFKKSMPKDFWDEGVEATWLDTKPYEEGRIWFERLYTTEDAKGKITIVAAYKIVFEGTDVEKARYNPKIVGLEIELDKRRLKGYNARLMQAMAINHASVPAPQKKKKKPKGAKDEKPPEVEKLEN